MHRSTTERYRTAPRCWRRGTPWCAPWCWPASGTGPRSTRWTALSSPTQRTWCRCAWRRGWTGPAQVSLTPSTSPRQGGGVVCAWTGWATLCRGVPHQGSKAVSCARAVCGGVAVARVCFPSGSAFNDAHAAAALSPLRPRALAGPVWQRAGRAAARRGDLHRPRAQVRTALATNRCTRGAATARPTQRGSRCAVMWPFSFRVSLGPCLARTPAHIHVPCRACCAARSSWWRRPPPRRCCRAPASAASRTGAAGCRSTTASAPTCGPTWWTTRPACSAESPRASQVSSGVRQAPCCFRRGGTKPRHSVLGASRRAAEVQWQGQGRSNES